MSNWQFLVNFIIPDGDLSSYICGVKWKQDFDIASNPIITPDSRILSIGSCFSDHIGEIMKSFYIDVALNPFGVLFNPVAIADSMERISRKDQYGEKDITLYEGMYHMLDLHGSFQNKEIAPLLEKANEIQLDLEARLPKTDVVIITLGTSVVHKYVSTGRIAGNNHKFPSDHFSSHQMTVSDVRGELIRTIRALRKLNSKVKILLTVSPVRHLRTGTVANQRSKSTLIVAVHEALDEFKDVFYFPAYEILMDELRDYRFYREDLMHPSAIAIQYVWERFTETHFDAKARLYLEEVDKWNKMAAHRPRETDSFEYRQLVYKMQTMKEALESKWNIKLPEIQHAD